MVITPARADDYPTLIKLIKMLLMELGDEASDIDKMNDADLIKQLALNVEKHIIYVARDDSKRIVGMITIAESFAVYAGGHYGVINEMYVVPECRSQQIGTRLLDEVKNLAVRKNWNRIDVTAPTEERWKRTVKFYEKQGFVFTGPKLKFSLS